MKRGGRQIGVFMAERYKKGESRSTVFKMSAIGILISTNLENREQINEFTLPTPMNLGLCC